MNIQADRMGNDTLLDGLTKTESFSEENKRMRGVANLEAWPNLGSLRSRVFGDDSWRCLGCWGWR